MQEMFDGMHWLSSINNQLDIKINNKIFCIFDIFKYFRSTQTTLLVIRRKRRNERW